MLHERKININRVITYILIIKVQRKFKTAIGAKGEREFDKGYYLYVGSGKRNLMQRLRRHLRMEKKKFWHIDHMLGSKWASIRDIYVSELTEEEMVRRLEGCCYTRPYNSYFGASDSRRESHLFYCATHRAVNRTTGLMHTW
jgi:Uri superfamily endonuclease